jgi:hypothetical protein
MPRGLALLILLLVLAVVGAVIVAGRVREQPLRTIEVNVEPNAAAR